MGNVLFWTYPENKKKAGRRRIFIMARFTLPRDLYHGKGALEALKTFEGKRAIICVGGGSMKRFGFLEKAQKYLEEAGMEVKLFEGIEPADLRSTRQKRCGSNMNIRM